MRKTEQRTGVYWCTGKTTGKTNYCVLCTGKTKTRDLFIHDHESNEKNAIRWNCRKHRHSSIICPQTIDSGPQIEYIQETEEHALILR